MARWCSSPARSGSPQSGPSLGAAAGGGTVLTATSTTSIVTVDLDVSEEYLVKPGDAVTVVLPDGASSVGGHIETACAASMKPGSTVKTPIASQQTYY